MSIIFFIYHPGAFSNWINKLAPFFDNSNVFVFHISKLHDIDIQPDTKKDYKAIDISYYSFEKLEETIREINPCLFVFLSFRSLLEYVINKLCVNLNIHKVYLEHGLFSTDTMRFRTNKLKKEIIRTTRRQFAYWYLLSGLVIHSRHPWQEIKSAQRVYLKNDFGYAPYDHYFLFSRRSFDCYRTIFQLNKDNITYIGYPIFNNDAEKQGISIQEKDNGVLYVHQPLISDGIAKISFEEEKSFLKTIAKLLEKRYGKFTILLHPRSNLKEYKERYNGSNIEIVQSPNNYRYFACKSLIIGHYSTALLYGLYFNKPTITIDYPTVKTAEMFKHIFTYCENIEYLSSINIPIDATRKSYIVGEHNTFEHIAKSLLSIT